MARVVQRRNNPPYLLILFVFLFLIATVAAVLTYLKNDELTNSLADATKKISEFGNSTEQATARTQLGAQAGLTKNTSLIGFYQKETSSLKDSILPGKPDEYRARLDRLVAAESRVRDMGLIPWIEHLNSELKLKDSEAGLLKESLAMAKEDAERAQNALDGVAKVIDKITKDRQADTAAVQEAIEKMGDDNRNSWERLEDRLAQQLATAKTQADRAKSDWEKVNKDRQDAEKKLQALIAAKKAERDMRPLDLASMTNQPDGKILRVLNDRVYINMGHGDKVQPAMTFSIYPAGPAIDENKIKGTLEILQVNDTTSECRVVSRFPSSGAVAPGDLIGNVAFVRDQTFYFVVKGQFDITGAGRTTSDGVTVIKDMITRSGGRLMDDVTVATDFLVMGESPEVPEKPGDDATEDEIDRYIQQMKVVQDYDKAHDEAAKYGIPILNSNRFMALIGYQPGNIDTTKVVQK